MTKALVACMVALLIIAFVYPLPYAAYQLTRWLVCIVCVSYAYKVQGGKQIATIAIAVVFNPIVPIHFERMTWCVVDQIAACILAWLTTGTKSKFHS